MKIVNLIGGLGNQMFQAAFAIALKQQFPHEIIKLDISHFNKYNLHNGFEIHDIFKEYPLEIATKKELKAVTTYIPNYKWSRIYRRIVPSRKTEHLQPYQMAYVYDSKALKIDGDCYYEGYWMSPLYFEFCKSSIIDAFTFAPFDTIENFKYAELISKDNSVTIHVRRGDYVNALNFKDICTLEYYRNAIVEAKKHIIHPIFFVFSNDVIWCKDNMGDLFENYEVHFINNNKGKDSYRDMQLMSLARCNILANSSFSWWGAFLNSRTDQIVFVPQHWVNNISDKDAYINNWIKI